MQACSQPPGGGARARGETRHTRHEFFPVSFPFPGVANFQNLNLATLISEAESQRKNSQKLALLSGKPEAKSQSHIFQGRQRKLKAKAKSFGLNTLPIHGGSNLIFCCQKAGRKYTSSVFFVL